MSPAVVELHVGGRVWFEGSMYLVQELGPQRTTLTADGRLRSVATADVAATPPCSQTTPRLTTRSPRASPSTSYSPA